jgi:hypothetical protein
MQNGHKELFENRLDILFSLIFTTFITNIISFKYRSAIRGCMKRFVTSLLRLFDRGDRSHSRLFMIICTDSV